MNLLMDRLTQLGAGWVDIMSEYAFHTAEMADAAVALVEDCAQVHFGAGGVPRYSTVTGERMLKPLVASYWGGQPAPACAIHLSGLGGCEGRL